MNIDFSEIQKQVYADSIETYEKIVGTDNASELYKDIIAFACGASINIVIKYHQELSKLLKEKGIDINSL